MWTVTNGQETLSANNKINAEQIGIIKVEDKKWETYFIKEVAD